MTTRPKCVGVILAGGRATRFEGRPKGLERIDGLRIIDRVADALRGVTDELLLVANAQAATDWLPGVPVAPDVRPGLGAIGGIHAALSRVAAPILVVAWDMPFVSRPLLEALRQLGERGFDAAVPESGSPRGLEPLCAYYTPACLSAIERHLDAGDRRIIGFFDDVHLRRLAADAVRRFGDPDHLFFNVNTPDDLETALGSVVTPTR